MFFHRLVNFEFRDILLMLKIEIAIKALKGGSKMLFIFREILWIICHLNCSSPFSIWNISYLNFYKMFLSFEYRLCINYLVCFKWELVAHFLFQAMGGMGKFFAKSMENFPYRFPISLIYISQCVHGGRNWIWKINVLFSKILLEIIKINT